MVMMALMITVRSRESTNTDLSAAALAHDEEEDELGQAKMRSPDYTPFESPFLNLLSSIAVVSDALRSRSFLYAIKAAILSALTTLPNFIA